MQQCRETEKRDQTSEVVRHWRIFDTGSSKKVIEKWGREELQVMEDHVVDESAPEKTIFSHNGEARVGLPLEDIKKDKRTWLSWDAQSIKRQSAADELIRAASDSGLWGCVSEAWRARVVPEGQFILCRERKEMWFCVYSTDYMVLSWPCIRVGNMVVALDRTVSALQWKLITDLCLYEVVPSSPISPVHAFLRGDIPIDKLGVVIRHDNPVPLLEWQAKRAFASVPLQTMLKLARELKVDTKQPDETDMDFESVVAMDLMMHIDRAMPACEVQSALVARPLLEKPSIVREDICGDAPVQMLMESVSRSDAGKVKDFQADVSGAKERCLRFL